MRRTVCKSLRKAARYSPGHYDKLKVMYHQGMIDKDGNVLPKRVIHDTRTPRQKRRDDLRLRVTKKRSK